MAKWERHGPLGTPSGDSGLEHWVLRDGSSVLAAHPVALTLGKKLDVRTLRSETSVELLAYAAQFRAIIDRLYADKSKLRALPACPACGGGIENCAPAIEVHGVGYVACGNCGHVFIPKQPVSEALFESFEGEEGLSTFYVDPKTLEFRMQNIIAPKLDWVLDAFKRQYGGAPASILDVGAGGGHFVAGCRRRGLAAEGVEISRTSVRFAQSALGVALRHGNYLVSASSLGTFDLLTFWGLLEYAPNPGAFFAAARRQLTPGAGMLIVEVPRADSFSLEVQKQFTKTIWRHAMPDSHMNLYSDASLATLLHDNGFKPVAAWYFGMDIYEYLMQAGLAMATDRVMAELGDTIAPLQEFLDRARLSDDIVVAAVPV